MTSISSTSPRPVALRQPSAPTEADAPAPSAAPVEAPRTKADPTQRNVDAVEGEADARRRQAEAAISAQAPVSPRAQDPLRTVHEVSQGIGTRTRALERANEQVSRLERDLQQQLRERGPALSQEERQRLVTAFRERPENARHYAEAERAATDLSGYLAQNAARLRGGLDGLTPAQAPMAEQAGLRLTAASQALEQTRLRNPAATDSVAQNLSVAADVLSAGLAVGSDVMEGAAASLRSVAGAAAGATGALASGLSAFSRLQTIGEGRGNTGEHVGLAGDGVSLAGSAGGLGAAAMEQAGIRGAAMLGMASGAAVAAGTVLSIGGTLYSTHLERQRTQREAERSLLDSGHAPEVAAGLARAHPGTLRAFEQAGFRPEQLQELARGAAEALRVPGDVSQRFLAVARSAGLSTEEIGGLLRAAGPGAVSLVVRGAELASGRVPTSREQLARDLGVASRGADPRRLAPAIEFLRGQPIRP